ncbi:hypothetical protein PS685_01619 [Pseudomonas fluorescens]|uniref:Uncharacterized protein n=1 Tax=Pseudomonas fluorescens TaxID=294 RepID=A0A5E6YKR8_PSEFL|nr:hypothetical protein PS685_01619 [Pseudomonas fluorescens]
MQNALDALADAQLCRVEIIAQLFFANSRTVHARRLAQQHFQWHVHRVVAEVAVGHGQLRLGSGFTDDGKRATLAFADRLEALEIFDAHRQNITFLGFVAPDFVRGHARLVVWNVAQFETATTVAVVHQLRECVGQTASTHIVDKADRVLVTQLPAAVDHFLATTLHFRVFALYRSEVQVSRACAGGHRGCCTATQADQHGRTAQHDELGAHGDFGFLHVFGADVAHAAGQHDRLVVTTHFFATGGGDGLLECTEVTGQGRTTEFIVECSTAQRAFDHDVQRGNNALRLAVRHFPRLYKARDLQVGHGETGQTSLWLGTTTGCTFVTDLTTGACRCTRERGNGGRVVVGLYLHQDVHWLLHRTVLAGFRIREETPGNTADDNRRVVFISRQNAFAVHHVGVLDHAKQALVLALAVDVPAGVEDLVAAMLGVGLGKHHQFDVVRVATQTVEGIDQIIDFVFGQGKAQLDVGFFQRGTTATQYVNRGQRLWLGVAEQACSLLQSAQHDLRHAVMQYSADQFGIRIAELASYIECNAAFQALDFSQATVTGNVAGLARPGRDGAKPRQHQEQSAARLLDRHAWAVLQETSQYLLFIAGQLTGGIGKVGEFSIQTSDRRNLEAQLCKEFAVAKGRKGRSAAQDQHLRDSLGRGML